MSLLSKLMPRTLWQYGTCFAREHEPCLARRHRFQRNVQMILHKKGRIVGDYVYKEDFWHDFHEDWWKNFKTEDERQAEARLVQLVATEIEAVAGCEPIISRLAARNVLERLRRPD